MEYEIFLKIILSAFLGGLFGIDQEFSGKNSSLRAIMLITTGSTLLISLSNKTGNIIESSNPILIISLVIAGTGFLGGAAIVRSVTVKNGLFSGAKIWVATGVGITVGLGFYPEAFIITVLIIILIRLLMILENRFNERSKFSSYSIRIKKNISVITEIKKVLMECGISNYEWYYEKVKGGFILELTLVTSGSKNTVFTEKLMEMDDIENITSENV